MLRATISSTADMLPATCALSGLRPEPDRALRVLALSSLFPNAIEPRHGIFLKHRLGHLARMPGIELRMVAPVPWFPSALRGAGRYGRYARVPRASTLEGVRTLYPRYPVLPKLGMRLSPTLMAAALLPTLRRLRADGFDFDVIDAYYLYPDGMAASLLGKALRRPVVLTAFGTDVSLLPNYRMVRAQILWAIRHSAGVTCVCRALADKLIELGAEPQKIDVILHGVDLDLFRPPPDRPALRRDLGLVGPTLLSVGHLIQRKGHGLAIESLTELPGVQLMIAGSGPLERALRHQAETLGVAERVRFLGQVNQAALSDLMGAADALVLCSDREGIANVLMEAMACGTPVAATPVWGSPEVVCNPDAGLLLKERSVTAVVQGVRALLAKPPDRTRTRAWAEGFSWTETAKRHVATLRSAVVPA